MSGPETHIFKNEDHTLGVLLRSKLLADSHVLFAGYRIEHPMFPILELCVQTTDDTTPTEAIVAASVAAMKELDSFEKLFVKSTK